MYIGQEGASRNNIIHGDGSSMSKGFENGKNMKSAITQSSDYRSE